jgi:transcriptional regulator of acetoin/glycerol metabolism
VRDPGLVVVWSGVGATMVPFRVPPTGATLGRELLATRDIAHLDDRLSRQHARVAPVATRFAVTDLGSRNGTFVHGDELRGTDGSVVPPSVIRTGRTLWAVVGNVGLYEQHPVTASDTGARGPSSALAYERALVAAHRDVNLVIAGEHGVGKRTLAAFYAGKRGSAVLELQAGELAAARLPAGRCTIVLAGADALSPVEQTMLGAWLDVRADLRVALLSATTKPYRATLAPPLVQRLEGEAAHLAPVRERPEEVALLVEHTVRAHAPGLDAHTNLVEECLLRSWPDNLRGIEAAVGRAARLARHQGVPVVRSDELAASSP